MLKIKTKNGYVKCNIAMWLFWNDLNFYKKLRA